MLGRVTHQPTVGRATRPLRDKLWRARFGAGAVLLLLLVTAGALGQGVGAVGWRIAGRADAPSPVVLDKDRVQGTLGKSVRSIAGEDMGHIVDIVVDLQGIPRAAVIDFGGFLGVGSRKIAVNWHALRFAPREKPDQITLALTRDQVKAVPEYTDKNPVVIGASGVMQPLPEEKSPQPE